jgi:hypothetical protein
MLSYSGSYSDASSIFLIVLVGGDNFPRRPNIDYENRLPKPEIDPKITDRICDRPLFLKSAFSRPTTSTYTPPNRARALNAK